MHRCCPWECGTQTARHAHHATRTLIGPLDSGPHATDTPIGSFDSEPPPAANILIGLRPRPTWVFTCLVGAQGAWVPVWERCALASVMKRPAQKINFRPFFPVTRFMVGFLSHCLLTF